MYQPGRLMRFVRTTAIGGAIFLLPLIVVAAAIGQVVPIVMSVAEGLRKVLPDVFETPRGFSFLIVIAIILLLLVCFIAGISARKSFARHLSEWFEKKLTLLFPRYVIIKDQMADSIGGDQTKPQMKPVTVRFDDYLQLGFETERDEKTNFVAVYLPGSPDPWAGKVVFVEVDRVQPLKTDFGAAVATCEQLGRGSASAFSFDTL